MTETVTYRCSRPVSVCDTYLKRLFNVGYKKMVEELAIAKSDDASVAWAYNVHSALVPGVQFLAEWWPGDGGSHRRGFLAMCPSTMQAPTR